MDRLMITLEQLETKHNFVFPTLYRRLFEADMLNWMRGHENLAKDKTWADDVYPTLKENPPILLHSGGSDFELFTPKQILDFSFPETWDVENHHFIPFAKTAEGNIYAFYKNIKIENEHPIVLIWRDDESEYLNKNFEDFIFQKMLEASDDIDKDDIHADYGKDNPLEAYRTDLLADLKSIQPYLNEDYFNLLSTIYHAPSVDMLFSYAFESEEKLSDLLQRTIDFEFRGDVFDHEL